MPLLPHQERVVAEKADLDAKRTALNAFFGSQLFAGLDFAEQDRLRRQHAVMSEYSEILGERIEAFRAGE